MVELTDTRQLSSDRQTAVPMRAESPLEAAQNDLAKAAELIESVVNPLSRVERIRGYLMLATTCASGDLPAADWLAKAQDAAESGLSYDREFLLRDVAIARAATGDIAGAQEIAKTLKDPTHTLGLAIAKAQAAAGDLEGLQKTIHRFPRSEPSLFIGVAQTLADNDHDPMPLVSLALEAIPKYSRKSRSAGYAIPTRRLPEVRFRYLSQVANLLYRIGQDPSAVLTQAECMSPVAKKPLHYAELLVDCGRTDEALEILRSVEDDPRWETDWNALRELMNPGGPIQGLLRIGTIVSSPQRPEVNPNHQEAFVAAMKIMDDLQQQMIDHPVGSKQQAIRRITRTLLARGDRELARAVAADSQNPALLLEIELADALAKRMEKDGPEPHLQQATSYISDMENQLHAFDKAYFLLPAGWQLLHHWWVSIQGQPKDTREITQAYLAVAKAKDALFEDSGHELDKALQWSHRGLHATIDVATYQANSGLWPQRTFEWALILSQLGPNLYQTNRFNTLTRISFVEDIIDAQIQCGLFSLARKSIEFPPDEYDNLSLWKATQYAKLAAAQLQAEAKSDQSRKWRW